MITQFINSDEPLNKLPPAPDIAELDVMPVEEVGPYLSRCIDQWSDLEDRATSDTGRKFFHHIWACLCKSYDDFFAKQPKVVRDAERKRQWAEIDELKRLHQSLQIAVASGDWGTA